jgi:hypothetical protein
MLLRFLVELKKKKGGTNEGDDTTDYVAHATYLWGVMVNAEIVLKEL